MGIVAPFVHPLLVGHDLATGTDQPNFSGSPQLTLEPIPLGRPEKSGRRVFMGCVLPEAPPPAGLAIGKEGRALEGACIQKDDLDPATVGAMDFRTVQAGTPAPFRVLGLVEEVEEDLLGLLLQGELGAGAVVTVVVVVPDPVNVGDVGDQVLPVWTFRENSPLPLQCLRGNGIGLLSVPVPVDGVTLGELDVGLGRGDGAQDGLRLPLEGAGAEGDARHPRLVGRSVATNQQDRPGHAHGQDS